jgi:hypothetical protein
VVSNQPQPELTHYCEWWPLGTAAPCYAPASFMLVRPSGERLRPTCAQHLEGWRAQIVGDYEALTLGEWESRGRGYRGRALGG